MSGPQRGLGRGLDSLIPTQLSGVTVPVSGEQSNRPATQPTPKAGHDTVLQVAPSEIKPNPHQPRSEFEAEALADLSESLKTHGVLQPLVVTKSDGGYQLIAGERRLRAAKRAGLKTVPVIVRSFSEQQKLELALIENLQRAQLNAIETAKAYRKLMDEFNLNLDAISARVSKAKSTVSNQLRLLSLPAVAQAAISTGQISEAHGRALLAVQDPKQQAELLQRIIDQKLSVRQAEAAAQTHKAEASPGTSKRPAPASSPAQAELSQRLSQSLNAKVQVKSRGQGGQVVIDYTDLAELDRLVKRLSS